LRTKTNTRATVTVLCMLAASLAALVVCAVPVTGWPWDQPTGGPPPEYPEWQPTQPWERPPDERPPRITVRVRGVAPTTSAPTVSVAPNTTATDDAGLTVYTYDFPSDMAGWYLRLRCSVVDGTGTGNATDYYWDDGVDKTSVLLHVGRTTCHMSEDEATQGNTHRADYAHQLELKRGMDVRIWVTASDRAGNAASSEDTVVIYLRVRRPGRRHVVAEGGEAADLWAEAIVKREDVFLDKTKYAWLYYVAIQADTEWVGLLLWSVDVHPWRASDQILQKDAFAAGAKSDPGGRSYRDRAYVYWDQDGRLVGWLLGGDIPSAGFRSPNDKATASGEKLADVVGGDYGGIYTAIQGSDALSRYGKQ